MEQQQYEGMAGIYDKHRPEYPPQLMDRFAAACVLPQGGGLVLDVASGTGIATRLLRGSFPDDVALIGVEPGDDMRRTAVAQSQELPNMAFIKAPAEALPFDESAVDAILVAQAVHWFDRPRFYAEAVRVLKAQGLLGIMQNNRSWQKSPFLDAYESLLERFGRDYVRDYRRFDLQRELAGAAGLNFVEHVDWQHRLLVDKADFTAWSFSSTKMQDCVHNMGQQVMERQINQLIERYFAAQEAVQIDYRAELFLARVINER